MSEKDCPLCKFVKKEMDALKVFEDENIMAVMHPLPAHRGHLLIFEKKHRQIITEIADEILSKMFSVAQRLSAVVFDVFSVKGTNVLVRNGEAAGQTINHFCVHVIPRAENDGVSLEWQPKPGDEGQLSALEQKLRDGAKDIKTPEAQSETIKGDDNYMIKQLHRTA